MLEVERLAFGGIADLGSVADLVGVVGIEQDAVGTEFQRLEGSLGLLGGGDAGQQVGLLANAGDQVFEGNNRPVLADDGRVVGLLGGGFGEGLVVLIEDADVGTLWGVAAAAERRQIRGAGEVVRQIDRAVALAVLADEDGVGLAVAIGLDIVDNVGVRAERRDVDVAEFADPADIVVVDEHPVDAGLDTGRDPLFACLPVADGVVGLDPDGACHTRAVSARGLEHGGSW